MLFGALYACRFTLSCALSSRSTGCMRVFDRHIFSSLTAVFLLALASLLLLFFSVLILRYSELISEQHRVLSAVVAACAVGLPMHVSFFLPPAAGVAAFLCLRGWQREGAWLGGLVCGYDVLRWSNPVLLFALLCSVLGWVSTLWLGPHTARIYFSRLENLYAERFLLSTEPKRFVRLTNEVHLWIESKPSLDEFRNLVLTIEKPQNKTVVAAQSGRLVQSERGLMLETQNGTLSSLQNDISQTIRFQKLRYGLEHLVNPPQRWQNRRTSWRRLEIPTSVLLQQIVRGRQASAEAKKAAVQENEMQRLERVAHGGRANLERGAEKVEDPISKEQQKGEKARRELVLRLAYPLLSPVYVLAIFALSVPRRVRFEERWNGLRSLFFLIVYSTAHIYAITLSEQGGWATGAVFLLVATVCTAAYALARHKASSQT